MTIRGELEELTCVHRVTEHGREVDDRIAFGLSDYLAQVCTRELGIEHGCCGCLDWSQLGRITNEDDLALLGQAEDVLQQILVHVAGFIDEQQVAILLVRTTGNQPGSVGHVICVHTQTEEGMDGGYIHTSDLAEVLCCLVSGSCKLNRVFLDFGIDQACSTHVIRNLVEDGLDQG